MTAPHLLSNKQGNCLQIPPPIVTEVSSVSFSSQASQTTGEKNAISVYSMLKILGYKRGVDKATKRHLQLCKFPFLNQDIQDAMENRDVSSERNTFVCSVMNEFG